MNAKRSMDLFGEALFSYADGDRSKFYLKDKKGKKHIYSLSGRFRSYSKLNKLERKLILSSYGEILDIGCGTGNVISSLKKRGEVTGIDISPKVIEVAKKRGCENCVVADIFNFSPKNKFDTITLFGNDLGIGGTINKTRKLLQTLKLLLKKDGQILAITRNYNQSDYKIMTLTPMWKNRTGPKFNWLIFNIEFLSKLCEKQNMSLEVVGISWKHRLVRITKN